MEPPNFSLDGKLAVVTGAGRGIGRVLAEGLAGAGATVIATGRDQEALDEVVQAIAGAGGHAGWQMLDVADTGAIEPALARIAERHGRIDILVNNACTESVKPSIEIDPALWDRIVGTNLKGAFFCAQAAARRMAPEGAILNVCSLTSEIGAPGAAAYGASKSGLAGLTRTLATEWAERGIRVNGIGPGYFRTALTESFHADPAWQKTTLGRIPMRRFGHLADLVGAAVFLCSEAAAYITGQVLYIDGGYLAAI